MKRLSLISVFAFVATMSALADSPLTSTDFARTLNPSGDKQNNPEILKTFDQHGWGEEVMAILCSPSVPVEQRLCLVNYMGWNFNGQTHYPDLVAYYVRKNGIESKQQVFNGMYGEQMAVFAYVKAMDDYFDVRRAERLAREAKKRSPRSRAASVIHALILSQIALDNDWAEVYNVWRSVLNDKSLNQDFSDKSIQYIMEYIGLYEKYME